MDHTRSDCSEEGRNDSDKHILLLQLCTRLLSRSCSIVSSTPSRRISMGYHSLGDPAFTPFFPRPFLPFLVFSTSTSSSSSSLSSPLLSSSSTAAGAISSAKRSISACTKPAQRYCTSSSRDRGRAAVGSLLPSGATISAAQKSMCKVRRLWNACDRPLHDYRPLVSTNRLQRTARRTPSTVLD